jgi:hypothetical protein
VIGRELFEVFQDGEHRLAGVEAAHVDGQQAVAVGPDQGVEVLQPGSHRFRGFGRRGQLAAVEEIGIDRMVGTVVRPVMEAAAGQQGDQGQGHEGGNDAEHLVGGQRLDLLEDGSRGFAAFFQQEPHVEIPQSAVVVEPDRPAVGRRLVSGRLFLTVRVQHRDGVAQRSQGVVKILHRTSHDGSGLSDGSSRGQHPRQQRVVQLLEQRAERKDGFQRLRLEAQDVGDGSGGSEMHSGYGMLVTVYLILDTGSIINKCQTTRIQHPVSIESCQRRQEPVAFAEGEEFVFFRASQAQQA